MPSHENNSVRAERRIGLAYALTSFNYNFHRPMPAGNKNHPTRRGNHKRTHQGSRASYLRHVDTHAKRCAAPSTHNEKAEPKGLEAPENGSGNTRRTENSAANTDEKYCAARRSATMAHPSANEARPLDIDRPPKDAPLTMERDMATR